ncbi:beta galactosidase jelly roll domain-containing protein, partial [bacterium]|nr:beta galactosidase jelly roll domain-containing protein [bacterium]
MNSALHASDLIINVDNRKTTSLNGKWQIIVDPQQSGYLDSYLQLRQDGYFKNEIARHKSDRVEYRFDDEETLNVPGDWNSQREKLLYYEGTIWYKKSFDCSPKPNSRLFLYFGAANYTARVYLNGEEVGVHDGGYTPFNFEITHLVKTKDNCLVVMVDNTRRRDAVPTLQFGWWNYGGLTRRVMLIEETQTFIQDYFIQFQKGSIAAVQGWVKLNGPDLNQQIKIEIPEVGIEEAFETDNNGVAKIAFDANLKLWSTEDPKLYDVLIRSESQTIQDQIGFRTIETRGEDILLNGESIFLRGISIHEEAPHHPSRPTGLDDARTLLGWAKELGCNYVRLAHYPHNEFMVRLADRIGLLVWSEIPVYWGISFEAPNSLESAKSQLTEMITRDKNRASVILWSIANETLISDVRTDFLRRLARHARELDDTRLVTAALERLDIDDNTILMNDPIGEHLDVLGYNQYIGWYDGSPGKCGRVEWKTEYNKPLIMSEFGGGALYNHHGDPETRWT